MNIEVSIMLDVECWGRIFLSPKVQCSILSSPESPETVGPWTLAREPGERSRDQLIRRGGNWNGTGLFQVYNVQTIVPDVNPVDGRR